MFVFLFVCVKKIRCDEAKRLPGRNRLYFGTVRDPGQDQFSIFPTCHHEKIIFDIQLYYSKPTCGPIFTKSAEYVGKLVYWVGLDFRTGPDPMC